MSLPIDRTGRRLLYDRNRSDAVASACKDVTQLVSAALEILRRDDLTQEQRQEIAGAFSARGISFDVEISIEHEP